MGRMYYPKTSLQESAPRESKQIKPDKHITRIMAPASLKDSTSSTIGESLLHHRVPPSASQEAWFD